MAGRQRREELQQRRSGDALAHYYRASGVHAVNLKNRLRDIETDRANLALRDRGVRQKLVQLVI
jgi:hypothetical protein